MVGLVVRGGSCPTLRRMGHPHSSVTSKPAYHHWVLKLFGVKFWKVNTKQWSHDTVYRQEKQLFMTRVGRYTANWKDVTTSFRRYKGSSGYDVAG